MEMGFLKGLELPPVEMLLEVVNAAFFMGLLSWIFIEFFRRRRDHDGDVQMVDRVVGETVNVFRIITVLCNVIISISYLGFGFYEYWNQSIVSFESVTLVLTWVLATAVVFYAKNHTTIREHKIRRWPVVLILWWVFSFITTLLSVSVYLLVHLRSIEVPHILPEAEPVDFISLPFLIMLCLNALPGSCNRNLHDLEHPLLQKENKNSSRDANSFANAGVWSKLTFRWLNPLFKRGRTQKLELPHIPSIPHSETAENASSLLEESLQKRKMESSSLPKVIIYTVWKSLATNAVLAGINTVASYVGPLLITNFVNFLSGKHDDSSSYNGLLLACIFFFSKTVESLTQRQWYFGAQRIGIRVRAALTVLIYKKSLSIKFVGPSSGIIINMINVDVERIGDFCLYIHGIWLLPVQVFLALVILYRNLGAAPAAAALFSTILVMVSNTPLANRQERLHSKIMEAKDSRIKATSETLKSMRVLKLLSWESTFLKKLLQLREIERLSLKKYLYTCSAVAFLFWASPTLISVITFGVCILMKTPLTSGTVLSALATFRILQEPIYNLPELISMIAQTKVSVDRIQEFLREEDQKRSIPDHRSKASNTAVEIEVGEYAWETSDQNLKKSTVKIAEKMKIMKGYKVAVCGSVGSGKSSLLCSILGEIPKISGTGVKVYGTTAYVPQSAWIQTGTIRENVLFGKDMDKSFYEDVLDGCALNQDIEMWVDGDLSVVGERGMNLSGGQKQRIQLARAECLMGLLSQKTVIYATHQLEFLDGADLVLVMKDGKIVQSGKYEDLTSDPNGELVRQMNAHRKSLDQVNPPQEDSSLTRIPCQIGQNEVTEERFSRPINYGNFLERSQEDETKTGRVRWSVYSTFITLVCKGALVPVILLCQVLFQGLQMGSNYWIAWATDEKRKVSRGQLIGVFVLLSGGSSVFILGRAVLLATIAMNTAQRLFHDMITSVFRAPISFFDSTPSSQILNRSSTDQSSVDTDIPFRLAGLAFALIQLLSIIFLMSLVAWQVFYLFLIILGISIWYQAYYITTARELARMVGIRKAPILHHFSESIAGLAGLAVTYGLNLNVLQAWVIWNLCNVENKMISVERILQFTNIPSEAPLEIKDCRPDSEWPTSGNIELKNLHVQYTASLPMILKGITCTFPGEKKIGVVGRTGSGKSTLIQALFRVVEPSEGQILIDGIDISKIGLQDLRSRLGIIPQEPMLFQGTVRTNIDPLEQHSDQEIWEVVNKCHLLEIIRQDQRLLDAPVAEDGENWSVGQRQLVCLARVLLKKRRILVLDEATASIDTATDNVIQETIREETSRCTVITVAHRIPTVIDNDLVLVLDEGKVAEYDSPAKLLESNSSSFSKLVGEFLRRSSKSNRNRDQS
ncbi:hypothetical protein Pint_23652 [Pistacia integerrima]|uniref:Uncharacterized protein n=1 Tax=Pistacia integerrima TaxID=434235 RepID=A0ACC0YHN6_9ROSI|nr:hypothetical protein Pint_23652 [Pistacia integerrima]